MADKSEERKSLSKLGATRLSRNEALRFLASKEKCCNYYTLMVHDTDDSGAKQLGYIMYQDLRTSRMLVHGSCTRTCRTSRMRHGLRSEAARLHH
eukprot:3300923-Heterocapsa_arctica.AAC.1